MINNDRLELLQKLGNIGIFEWYNDSKKTYISSYVYSFFNEVQKSKMFLEPKDSITQNFICNELGLFVASKDIDVEKTVFYRFEDTCEERYFNVHLTKVHKDSEFEKVFGIITDVTNRVQSEMQLVDANNRFKTILEKAPFPIFVHIKDGRIIMANSEVERQSGYSHEEVDTLEKWIKAVHPNREDYNTEFIKNNFDAEEILVQGEKEIVVTKNQEERVWEFHNSFIKDFDGHKAMLTICIDVTEKDRFLKEQTRLLKELHESQLFLKASLNSPKDMIIIAINEEYNLLFFNDEFSKNMKGMYDSDVQYGSNLIDMIQNEEDRVYAAESYNRALNGESFSNIHLYGVNHDLYFETYYNPVKNNDGDVIAAVMFSQNVTERQREIERIKESEEKFRLIYSSMSQSLAVHEVIVDETNTPIDYRFVDINTSYEKLFNYDKEKVIGKRIKEIAPNIEDYWIKELGTVAITGEPKYYENYSREADKHFSTYAYSPKKGQFAVLISDISERIKRENEITYLSLNDQLTGVFNRRYYEQQVVKLDTPENLPLSMVMGDVNGLKLINDSFGHQKGDLLLQKVATIFKQACRTTDVITRIGGDEFVFLLPNTSLESAEMIVQRIHQLTENETVESIDISISFGIGTKVSPKQNLQTIFKEVEDEMYRKKLIDGKSMRSKTVDLIMQTLYEKNYREMSHSKRVSAISEMIAIAMKKDQDFVKQVQLGGLMHDIGKIGIDEQVLNKNGSLTEKEWIQTKKHSEIGYRILSSINEFSEIAQHILEHHEKYDGSGYPKGLIGKDISLQARIISISDAFDAMTGPRPYKEAVSMREAKNEILKCSGTHFDPEVVSIFIKEVYSKLETGI